QRGEGWVEKKLGDICITTQGVQIPKKEQAQAPQEGYRRYLYISDFEHTKNVKYVQDIYPKKVVTTDDLIVVNTGASAGKIFRGIDGILSNNLFRVTFDVDFIHPDFLYYFVTSAAFKSHQRSIVKGAANPHMGHENFKSTPFSHPSLAVQADIAETIAELSSSTQQLEALYTRKLNDLKELKQSLLQQAFAGELTKEDAA
ncbi:MAG: restriction endonuclease subunit S, partial [Coraliomargarita sp.]